MISSGSVVSNANQRTSSVNAGVGMCGECQLTDIPARAAITANCKTANLAFQKIIVIGIVNIKTDERL